MTCILGSGVKNVRETIRKIEGLPPNFCGLFSPTNIAKLFSEAALVVSAAGTTQFELQYLRTPALLLITHENQWKCTSQLKLEPWCRVLDIRSGFDGDHFKSAISKLLTRENLSDMHLAIPSQQGNGTDNAASVIINYLEEKR